MYFRTSISQLIFKRFNLISFFLCLSGFLGQILQLIFSQFRDFCNFAKFSFTFLDLNHISNELILFKFSMWVYCWWPCIFRSYPTRRGLKVQKRTFLFFFEINLNFGFICFMWYKIQSFIKSYFLLLFFFEQVGINK